MSKQLKVFIFLLAIGFIFRLFISYFQYSGDIKNHLVWANGFLKSPIGFYEQKFPGFNDPNYPPLAIILFGASHLLYLFTKWVVLALNNLPLFPSALVPFILSENTIFAFLKLPGIISDLFIGWFIFNSSQASKQKYSYLLGLLFVLNPATIYLSSVWGQTESVTALFLVLSLVNRNKQSSLVYFALAALTKQTALWLAPFYLLYWLKNQNIKQITKGFLVSIVIFYISYLLFGLGPVNATKNYLGTLSGSSTVVSDAAWNFWHYILPAGTNDDYQVFGVSVRFVSIALLLGALAILLKKLSQQRSQENLADYLFFWSFLAFFLQTRVHERHLYPALVFLLMSTFKIIPQVLLFIIISIFYYLNLRWSLRLPFI